jgi:tetratricopeptide (TPR) repeat protein
LREWIRLDEKDPRPYRWLGLIARDTEEGTQEAIEVYGRLVRLDLESGERAAAIKELAETQIAGHADYQLAMDTLAQAPEAFQDRPSFLLLRADCLLGLGRHDDAKRLVEGVLQKHAALENALLFRANLYLKEDQPREAIPLPEKVRRFGGKAPRREDDNMGGRGAHAMPDAPARS